MRAEASFTGLERGLDVHVLADAVSSCNSQEIPIALERMRQSGARITTTESILFQLMGECHRQRLQKLHLRPAISGRITPELQGFFPDHQRGKGQYREGTHKAGWPCSSLVLQRLAVSR